MNPNIDWAQFKSICSKRALDIIMLEYATVYYLSASESSVAINCKVFKDEGADCVDFETNYKDSCNPQVGNRSEMIPDGRFSDTFNSNSYLSTPRVMRYEFPSTYPVYQLWGMSGHVIDFGEADHIRFNIVDVNDVLGYGTEVIIKAYDEMWCQSIAKSTSPFLSPDGYPGIIPAGLFAEVLYYATDATKTNVRFFGDLLITVGS